jgi:hypothetical protein
VSWEVALVLSLASAFGSLWLTRFVLLRLPSDYFVSDTAGSSSSRLAFVGRNVAGFLLIVVGLVLAVPGIPGQGVLTMIVGLVLLDVPGKRGLERRILGRPRALAMINRARERAGVAPLEPPRDESRA